MRRFFHEVFIGADRLISALTGGQAEHTVSYRLGRAAAAGHTQARLFCRVLDLFDEGHCQRIYEGRPEDCH